VIDGGETPCRFAMAPWNHLHSALGTRLAASGLDLAAPLNANWYRRSDLAEIPALESFPDDAYLLVVGNTGRMWPKFIRALRDDPERLDRSDPLDEWVERQVREALAPLVIEFRILWGHTPMNSGGHPPLQQLAAIAGLAGVSPTHLSVHPVYGAWIALRAAIVFDLPGPAGCRPEPPTPCRNCGRRCERALERALGRLDETESPPDGGVRASWRDWVAVRDACSASSKFRYSDDQIRYHYTKDRDHLARAAGLEGEPRPSANPSSVD